MAKTTKRTVDDLIESVKREGSKAYHAGKSLDDNPWAFEALADCWRKGWVEEWKDDGEPESR